MLSNTKASGCHGTIGKFIPIIMLFLTLICFFVNKSLLGVVKTYFIHYTETSLSANQVKQLTELFSINDIEEITLTANENTPEYEATHFNVKSHFKNKLADDYSSKINYSELPLSKGGQNMGGCLEDGQTINVQFKQDKLSLRYSKDLQACASSDELIELIAYAIIDPQSHGKEYHLLLC